MQELLLYPENINYTTYIDFNTDSTYIIENIIANFAPYTFSTQKYEIQDAQNNVCSDIMGVSICVDKNSCKDIIPLDGKKHHKVESKIINKTINI